MVYRTSTWCHAACAVLVLALARPATSEETTARDRVLATYVERCNPDADARELRIARAQWTFLLGMGFSAEDLISLSGAIPRDCQQISLRTAILARARHEHGPVGNDPEASDPPATISDADDDESSVTATDGEPEEEVPTDPATEEPSTVVFLEQGMAKSRSEASTYPPPSLAGGVVMVGLGSAAAAFGFTMHGLMYQFGWHTTDPEWREWEREWNRAGFGIGIVGAAMGAVGIILTAAADQNARRSRRIELTTGPTPSLVVTF